MTRRSRRASSAPRTVGSEEGLTSSRPHPDPHPDPDLRPEGGAGGGQEPQRAATGGATEEPAPATGERPTPRRRDQTKDDTDEGWGERGDDEAGARWLKENRPPHWS